MIGCGFACSYYLLVQRSLNPELLRGESLVNTLVLFWFVALGDDLSGIMDMYQYTETPALTMMIYIAWVLVSSVLMLNLL